MHLKIILFFCFLIISCDLPNEANIDCYGTSNGNAFINECGYCVGGNSPHNVNKGIVCNRCVYTEGDENVSCDACGNSNAINYLEAADEDSEDWNGIDGSCLCTEVCNDDGEHFDIEENDGAGNGFIDGCVEHDEELCVDNVCDDYLPSESLESEQYPCNDLPNNSIYNEGDLLSCEDVEKNYSISYPDECETEFKLADLYGKVIFVEISTSW